VDTVDTVDTVAETRKIGSRKRPGKIKIKMDPREAGSAVLRGNVHPVHPVHPVDPRRDDNQQTANGL